MPSSSRKGFTLIELIVVIFLMLMVYLLVFSYFTKEEKKPKPLSPQTLKSSLRDAGLLMDQTTLLCTDKCTRCYIRNGIDGQFQLYKGEIDLKDSEIYILDNRNELQLLEYGRFRDRKICLRLDFYPNGSSTKAILKTPQNAWLLPSFFGEPQKFNSIEDARDFWLQDTKLASDYGDYY